uniref:Ig-like domain-containing protein n=1 Tax=Sphaeramia orbicularis TaxID=375764 RepID=A0A672Y603_9TELE
GDLVLIGEERTPLSGREGEPVTLRCQYETSGSGIVLHWYRQHSDLQPPHFILWKGAKNSPSQYIRDSRFKSQTPGQTTELTIPVLTLADTALYYCEGSGIEPTASYQMDSAHSCLITVTVATATNQTLWEESHSPQTHISAKPADDTKHTDATSSDLDWTNSWSKSSEQKDGEMWRSEPKPSIHRRNKKTGPVTEETLKKRRRRSS